MNYIPTNMGDGGTEVISDRGEGCIYIPIRYVKP